jgi:hypothetical protein
LDDIYRDVSYNLDEDTFAEAEDLDIVRKRFIRAWEQLVDGYRVCLLYCCLVSSLLRGMKRRFLSRGRKC